MVCGSVTPAVNGEGVRVWGGGGGVHTLSRTYIYCTNKIYITLIYLSNTLSVESFIKLMSQTGVVTPMYFI